MTHSLIKTALAAAAVGITLTAPALAQDYPNRPITLIVPFPTGGTTDVLARALGNEMSKTLGQPVIVESKPGAGSTLGADYVAKAKPDGYTLLMGAVHHTIASSVYKKLPYDFQKDLMPITTVALVPNVLVINPAIPAKSVQELLTLAKAQPGKLAYGSNGTGTGQHLIGAQFESMGGVQLLHVPYKGSGPLTTDLMGGQIARLALHQERQAARIGGDHVPSIGRPARRTDPGRVGHERLQPGHVVRRPGPHGHARRDRCKTQP